MRHDQVHSEFRSALVDEMAENCELLVTEEDRLRQIQAARAALLEAGAILENDPGDETDAKPQSVCDSHQLKFIHQVVSV